MTMRKELGETVRLTIGLACIQCCEWRSIPPAREPGVVFGDLGIDAGDGSAVRPIICKRAGANHGKACSAQRCPIAVELAPAIQSALVDGVAGRFGVPKPVVEIVRGISKLVALPDPAAASPKT